MRVLLISVNRETEPYPVSPLGVAYISSAIKEKGHRVKVIDLCFASEPEQTIKKEIQDFNPDLIGISIRNIDNLTFNRSVFYLPGIKEVVDTIKAATDVPMVAGGSGFSLFPESILRLLGIEYGIIGEGEVSFQHLLDALAGNCNIEDIAGICFIRDGELLSNPQNHSGFAFHADRTVLDNYLYYDRGGMANIQSKRGCPFNCSYCTYPLIDGRSLRLRPPEEVVEEMERIKKDYDIGHIFFVDDIFNVPRDHAVGICEELIRKGIDIKWYCFATPYGMDYELASLMKRAKCQGVEFGSDSGSDEILKSLRKNFTSEEIMKASTACKKAGLPDAHYLLLGAPDEDINSLTETVKLFDSINPRAVIVMTGIRVYPDTYLRKRAEEEGIHGDDQDILEPLFYISPKIGAGRLLERVEDMARGRKKWIVPSLQIRCESSMLEILRKQGLRGPLWDML